MKLYIGTILTELRIENGMTRACCTWIVQPANNEEEALGHILKRAQETFPFEKGFGASSVKCEEAPQSVIEQVHDIYPKG